MKWSREPQVTQRAVYPRWVLLPIKQSSAVDNHGDECGLRERRACPTGHSPELVSLVLFRCLRYQIEHLVGDSTVIPPNQLVTKSWVESPNFLLKALTNLFRMGSAITGYSVSGEVREKRTG